MKLLFCVLTIACMPAFCMSMDNLEAHNLAAEPANRARPDTPLLVSTPPNSRSTSDDGCPCCCLGDLPPQRQPLIKPPIQYSREALLALNKAKCNDSKILEKIKASGADVKKNVK